MSAWKPKQLMKQFSVRKYTVRPIRHIQQRLLDTEATSYKWVFLRARHPQRASTPGFLGRLWLQTFAFAPSSNWRVQKHQNHPACKRFPVRLLQRNVCSLYCLNCTSKNTPQKIPKQKTWEHYYFPCKLSTQLFTHNLETVLTPEATLHEWQAYGTRCSLQGGQSS